jgi:hypothetical protein
MEIMDVDYNPGEDQPVQRAGFAMPREYGTIRHFGE